MPHEPTDRREFLGRAAVAHDAIGEGVGQTCVTVVQLGQGVFITRYEPCHRQAIERFFGVRAPPVRERHNRRVLLAHDGHPARFPLIPMRAACHVVVART